MRRIERKESTNFHCKYVEEKRRIYHGIAEVYNFIIDSIACSHLRSNIFLSIFRNKIGPTFNYAGIEFFKTLLQNHSMSFALVSVEFPTEFVRTVAGERDVDVLSENLGQFKLN